MCLNALLFLGIICLLSRDLIGVSGIKEFVFPNDSVNPGTWAENIARCYAIGGTLVSIETERDHNALIHFFNEFSISTERNYFVGLYSSDDVNFKWISSHCHYRQASTTDIMWYRKPTETSKACTVMRPADFFELEEVICHETFLGICEKSTNPDCVMTDSQMCNPDSSDTVTNGVADLQNCKDLCLEINHCLTIKFESASQACHLYQPVTTNPFLYLNSREQCPPNLEAATKSCYNATLYDTVALSQQCSHLFNPNGGQSTVTIMPITSTLSAKTTTTESTTVTDSASITRSIETIAMTTSTPTMKVSISGATTLFTSTSPLSSTSASRTSSTHVTVTTMKEVNLSSPRPATDTTTTTKTCWCACKGPLSSAVNQNLTKEEVQQKTESIKKELKLDKTLLSSTIRKKSSADDNRPIAKGIGIVLGVGILTLVFGLILLPDAIQLIRYILKVHFKKVSKSYS